MYMFKNLKVRWIPLKYAYISENFREYWRHLKQSGRSATFVQWNCEWKWELLLLLFYHLGCTKYVGNMWSIGPYGHFCLWLHHKEMMVLYDWKSSRVILITRSNLYWNESVSKCISKYIYFPCSVNHLLWIKNKKINGIIHFSGVSSCSKGCVSFELTDRGTFH